MMIEMITVGAFAENCYVVACDATREAVILDPGDEIDRILATVEKGRFTVTTILLTHAHIDHVKELKALQSTIDVPVLMHRADEFLLENLPAQAASFGLTTAGIPRIDRFIDEGDRIEFGRQTISVYHTPGHSPGSLTFVSGKTAFVGDVLFSGSIGRTDLPGGDIEILLGSIRNKILPLGDDVAVYPGHGPVTSVGTERNNNPFLLNLR